MEVGERGENWVYVHLVVCGFFLEVFQPVCRCQASQCRILIYPFVGLEVFVDAEGSVRLVNLVGGEAADAFSGLDWLKELQLTALRT